MDAPLGTDAVYVPLPVVTSTSTVGLPRLWGGCRWVVGRAGCLLYGNRVLYKADAEGRDMWRGGIFIPLGIGEQEGGLPIGRGAIVTIR